MVNGEYKESLACYVKRPLSVADKESGKAVGTRSRAYKAVSLLPLRRALAPRFSRGGLPHHEPPDGDS